MIDNIRKIVLESDTKLGRQFDIWVQILIIVSIVSYTVETIPGLPVELYTFLKALDVVIIVIFTVEYILRVVVAEKKLSYIFSFYGIIDLLAILPFYLASGVELQTLRILRLLRLFRVLKLTKYNKALKRLELAISNVKEELVLFAIVAGMLLYLSAVGIYHFEHAAQPDVFKSIFDCLWWAVITLTTVGYGDMYPITLGGQLFTFFILIIGLLIISIPTGLIASSLVETSKKNTEER